jgi:low temperature requirement protein LtrA
LLLSAAGDEGLVGHPADPAKLVDAMRLVGGSALFLAGALVIKRVICGRLIVSHAVGILMLLLFTPLALALPVYLVGVGVAAILVVVAVWEEVAIRVNRRRRGLDTEEGSEEKISMVEV